MTLESCPPQTPLIQCDLQQDSHAGTDGEEMALSLILGIRYWHSPPRRHLRHRCPSQSFS